MPPAFPPPPAGRSPSSAAALDVRRPPRGAAGREGLGPRGRQGRGRLPHARRGRGRGPLHARRAGRSATPGATVVIEAFLEGEEISVLARHRRPGRRAAAGVPGSQAPARGRRRPQHRRHGRLQPRVAVATPAAAGAGARARSCSRRSRRCGGGTRPFTGVLYAGLMVDRGGNAVGGGVQLPAGRSRDPGRAAAGRRRPDRLLLEGGARRGRGPDRPPDRRGRR